MGNTVFFSWQLDTPEREGRNLIEEALKAAIAKIGSDTTLEKARRKLELDRDTQNAAGSPPIVDMIFNKIDQSTIYVADLTFVATRIDGRKSPNPNVLMEYGWALNSRGTGRIVSVANVAYGKPSAMNMPFNLRHLLFPIEYECKNGANDEDWNATRSALTNILTVAFLAVLRESGPASSQEAKPYIPVGPVDGPGRFRRSSDPIGITTDVFSRSRGKQIFLRGDPAVWLRLVPRHHPQRKWRITELESLASSQYGGKFLAPLTTRARSYDSLRAEDGYGSFAIAEKDDIQTTSLSFVFSTGEIWGIDTELMNLAARYTRTIPDMREIFFGALDAYADLMQRMEVPPPYVWHAGMEDLRGRTLQILPPAGSSFVLPVQGECLADIVAETGDYFPGDKPKLSLRSFFAKLHDLCGLALPPGYDAD